MKLAISKLTGIALATVLGVTTLLAVLLAIAVGALVGTDAGTSWLLQKSTLWTKGALTLGAHQGSLVSGLSVESVSWKQERLTVDLDRVEVEVSWLDLLDGALTVDSLVADNVAIHWQSEPLSSRSLPALPQPFLPITVRRLAAKNVRLRSGDSTPITLDAITLAARWDTEGLAIRSVEVESPVGGLKGAVNIDGRAPYDLSGQLRVHAVLPELPDLEAELAISGELANLVFGAEIQAPYTASLVVEYNLSSSHFGHYSLAGPVSIGLADLKSEWPQIRVVGEVAGTGRGAELDYRAELLLDWSGQPLATVPLSIVGRIWPTGTAVETLLIEQGTEQIRGSGSIDWGSDTKAQFKLSIEKINPSSWWKDWPADWPALVNGAVQVSLAAPETGAQFGLEVTQLDLDGQLRDRPFQLSGVGEYKGKSWNLNDFTARYGGSRLAISASNKQTLEVSATLDTPDIGEWLSDASGSASVGLRLQGDATDPLIKLTLSGKEIEWGTRSLEIVNLKAVGSLSRHQVSLQISQSESPLELAWFGALEHAGIRPTDYRANLTKVNLSVPELADRQSWMLEASGGSHSGKSVGRVHWQPGQVEVEQSCLLSANSRLCVAGEWQAQGGLVTLSLANFPLQGLVGQLPEDYQLEATADLFGSLRFDPAAKIQWLPNFNLSTSSILISSPIAKSESSLSMSAGSVTDELAFEPFEVAPIQVTLKSTDVGPWQFVLRQPDVPVRGLVGDATLAFDATHWRGSSIAGSFKAVLADVALLETVLPYATDLTGTASGEVIFDGTLGDPGLEGLLQWSHGQFRLPEQGLSWTDVSLEVVFPALTDNGTRRIEVLGRGTSGESTSGERTSGGGTLVLTGTVDWSGDIKTSTGDGRLTGENVRVLNTDLAQIQATPDVKLHLERGLITLVGEVLIPKARVRIRKRPVSAVTVSDDQRIGGPTAEIGQKPAYSVQADVNLRFGDDVKFTGFGLDTTLGGGVALKQRGRLTTANGSIVTRKGTYTAYGQKLAVNRGRLLWSDTPLLKPAIDVDASRTPSKEVTVGLRASGAIERPEVKLYSMPGMTQSEQLSWLLFGRPLQSTSSAETSVMNEAALALGVRAGDFLTKRLGGGLGLDQVGIEVPAGEGNDTAALVLGKYLTPDLYVSYGISLLQALSTLRIEYALSQDWRVVTESSAERNSADVFFVKERQ